MSFYALLLQDAEPIFEVCDHFQKQTYRNRCYIASANGKQSLYVPTVHTKKGQHQPTAEVRIDYQSQDWRKQHLRTLATAYRSSPFFEFYEPEIQAIFEAKHELLLDLNIAIHRFVMRALQEPIIGDLSFSKTYEKTPSIPDFRAMVNAKSKQVFFEVPPYVQLFSAKNGFLPDVSILDLLFMQGPSVGAYLRGIKRVGGFCPDAR